MPSRVSGRADAGAELGIVLEHADRADHGVERGAAAREDRVAGGGRRPHPRAQPIATLRLDRPDAAMDDDHAAILAEPGIRRTLRTGLAYHGHAFCEVTVSPQAGAPASSKSIGTLWQ